MTKISLGFVPEHFSTPLHFAQKHGFFANHGIEVDMLPYPSGSGHLIQSLKDKTIDVSIGLTEAFVAGIGKGSDWYNIIGTYVDSPLCWAISTGSQRELTSVDELQGKTIGISRIGSGSYVMPFVLAQQKKWTEPFKFEIQNTFKTLREGVNHAEGVEKTDAFMWEVFTTKRYYDNGELKQIGHIYTPWPSWVISASTDLTSTAEGRAQLHKLLLAINEGVAYFNAHHAEAVEYISTHLDYSAEDATKWLDTVTFGTDVSHVDIPTVVTKTIETLQTASVLEPEASSKAYFVSVSK